MKNKRVSAGNIITLGGSRKKSTVTVTRTGTFSDKRYGEFSITLSMLNRMVENFKSNAYGQDISIDVAHMPSNGAAGRIVNLSVVLGKLLAEVEWTDYGVDAINAKGFNYISAEYSENFIDNEGGAEHGCVLLGAGLTVRPVIKHLDRVELSEEMVQMGSAIEVNFFNKVEKEIKMNKYLKKLLALANFKTLSEPVQKEIKDAFELSIKAFDEVKQETELEAIFGTFKNITKTLSEKIGDTVVKIDIPAIKLAEANTKDESVKTLGLEDIKDAVTAQILAMEKDKASAVDKDAKSLANNLKKFSEVIIESEGATEDIAKALAEDCKGLITSNLTLAEVTNLATHQLAAHNKVTADKKLAAMGWVDDPNGVVVKASSTARTLQERIDTMLQQTNSASQLKLSTTDAGKKALLQHPFIERVLAVFDQQNAIGIATESKMLAEGTVDTSKIDVPVGFKRTVIREALSDINVLELVAKMMDSNATMTTQIPYEERGSFDGDGRVFEGKGIIAAGIEQKMDTAFLEPIKIAMDISEEVMHFSRSSGIDWEAYGRNVESNARLVSEIITRKITNEMIRAADSYMAVTVSAEVVTSQMTGTNAQIKTARYPVVQPKQVWTLMGEKIGTPSNPITITLNGVSLDQYDPDADQAVGTYFKLTSANLGYIGLVSETGAAKPPPNHTACTITYDRATNMRVFDSAVPSGRDAADHWDGLLRAVGSCKASLMSERYIKPEFLLMSPILNDLATNAKGYAANFKREGSNLSTAGDLATIKSLPAFSSNAPGTQLGDTRILMGQRRTTTYTIAKVFTTGMPFEAVNSEGNPTAMKRAYGIQFSSLHTPMPLSGYCKSIIVVDVAHR